MLSLSVARRTTQCTTRRRPTRTMSGRVRARARVCPPFDVRLTRLVLQGASGVDNTQRRKWDKGEYAAKAAERQRQEVRLQQPYALDAHASPVLLAERGVSGCAARPGVRQPGHRSSQGS